MKDRRAQMVEGLRKVQAIRDRLAELERPAETYPETHSTRFTARVPWSPQSPLGRGGGHQHAPGLSRLRKFGNMGLRAAQRARGGERSSVYK